MPQVGGIGKTRDMKLLTWFAVFVLGTILAIFVCTVSAEEPTASPAPSVSDKAEHSTTEDTTEEDTTKEIDFASPDGKFAFLIGHGEDQQTIDLIDKKTEKVLQHIDDLDMGSVTYRVLWAPDSKRFALMTRAGHPNQDVMVFFLKGDSFRRSKFPS